MKTSTLKTLFVTLLIVLKSTQAFAQNMVSTRIDVRGSRYSDQMWVFAVPTCTRAFDNGWDAYKMFGTSPLIPQIFAMEATANFQIDAVPTLNNTYVAFKAGEDTVYTFTFNNEYVSDLYSQLYLIDSVANKTVDIFKTGTSYTFSVQPTDAPVKRFKIVTSLPIPIVTTPPVTEPPVVTEPVIVPPVVADPVIVPPVVTDPVIVPPAVTDPVIVPPVVIDPIVVADSKDKQGKDAKDKKDKDSKDKKDKKIKITCSKKMITVENTLKIKGKLKLYNATNGRLVKNYDFNANGTTTLSTNLPSGTYVVSGVAGNEAVSENIIIK